MVLAAGAVLFNGRGVGTERAEREGEGKQNIPRGAVLHDGGSRRW